jgi:hypothetical protein
MRRWRGLKSLVHDAVDHTADLVEEANASVAHTALKYLSLIEPLAEPARTVDAARGAITSGVIGAVKAVNRAVQVATDAGLDLATDLLEVARLHALEGGVAVDYRLESAEQHALAHHRATGTAAAEHATAREQVLQRVPFRPRLVIGPIARRDALLVAAGEEHSARVIQQRHRVGRGSAALNRTHFGLWCPHSQRLSLVGDLHLFVAGGGRSDHDVRRPMLAG